MEVVTDNLVREWDAARPNGTLTNDLPEPSFETDTNTDGLADDWEEYSAGTTAGVITYTQADGRVSGYSQRIQITPDGGDSGATYGIFSYTPAASYAQNDYATGSFWIKGTGTGVTLRIYVDGHSSDDSILTGDSDTITITGDWQRVDVSHNCTDASTDHTSVWLYIDDIDSGDTIDIYLDDAQITKTDYTAPYFENTTDPPNNDDTLGIVDTVGNNQGDMNNFCMTEASGWDGDGSASDPYSLVFDGTDDYVDCGDLSVAEDWGFAYECEFITSGAGIEALIAEGSSASDTPYVYMYLEDGVVKVASQNDAAETGALTGAATALTDGARHVAVLDVSSGTGQIYVDGAVSGSSGALAGGTISLNVAAIGSLLKAAATLPFDGAVVKARFYSASIGQAGTAQNFATVMHPMGYQQMGMW